MDTMLVVRYIGDLSEALRCDTLTILGSLEDAGILEKYCTDLVAKILERKEKGLAELVPKPIT